MEVAPLEPEKVISGCKQAQTSERSTEI